MEFPGEQDLRAERAAMLETLDALTDEEFESGPTLCDGWAPRDVLAHVMGIDSSALTYVRSMGNVKKGNDIIVAKARSMPRSRLMHRARHWADKPAPITRVAAVPLLGDLAVHHQDIVRGLGRSRTIPSVARTAILYEGMFLGAKKLVSHRVEPTDGGPTFGVGRRVRGTSEALGLWLSGRQGLEPELEFG